MAHVLIFHPGLPRCDPLRDECRLRNAVRLGHRGWIYSGQTIFAHFENLSFCFMWPILATFPDFVCHIMTTFNIPWGINIVSVNEKLPVSRIHIT